MLEMKGSIVKEQEGYFGFTKWIKLIIGSHGFKQGKVMIKPTFPGLAESEKKMNEQFIQEREKVRKENLLPLLRQLKQARTAEKKDAPAINSIELQIKKTESKIKSLEHAAHQKQLVGKRFRLIIYDD